VPPEASSRDSKSVPEDECAVASLKGPIIKAGVCNHLEELQREAGIGTIQYLEDFIARRAVSCPTDTAYIAWEVCGCPRVKTFGLCFR